MFTADTCYSVVDIDVFQIWVLLGACTDLILTAMLLFNFGYPIWKHIQTMSGYRRSHRLEITWKLTLICTVISCAFSFIAYMILYLIMQTKYYSANLVMGLTCGDIIITCTTSGLTLYKPFIEAYCWNNWCLTSRKLLQKTLKPDSENEEEHKEALLANSPVTMP